jgi:chemotaxis signal transduction protein
MDSLLDRRTTALATRPPRAGANAGRAQRSLIIWSLGDSLYGIEVAAVAAVIPFAGCARVPTREAACLGVIGRAGRFYSVIALRRLLGAAAAEAPPLHLLLLRGGAPYLALAVDRVLGRFDLPADGPASELDGRLVALFDPAERLAALRHSGAPS